MAPSAETCPRKLVPDSSTQQRKSNLIDKYPPPGPSGKSFVPTTTFLFCLRSGKEPPPLLGNDLANMPEPLWSGKWIIVCPFLFLFFALWVVCIISFSIFRPSFSVEWSEGGFVWMARFNWFAERKQRTIVVWRSRGNLLILELNLIWEI